VNPPYRPILAALGLLVFAAQAVAQETRVAAAADADVIAVYSQHVEKHLLRAHVDRAAATISLVPFGPPGVESFAVAPNGAFIVTSATVDQGAGTLVTSLFLLDEAGHALGEPLRSPVGAVSGLAISPKGDRIAVSSDRGWLALLAVEGQGQARRLVMRAEIGVSADRQFTYAFRPDGGLVTLVDDWVATYRASDGAVQRTFDLKTLNRDLAPADQDIGSEFQLTWSPRGDRFSVSWGGGPMMTTIFDSGGRRLKPVGAENGLDLPASKVEFVEGGDALILYGMTAPVLVHLKSLAATAFGDPGASVDRFAALAGGRDVAPVGGDRIALWSLEGKQLIKPFGLENYSLGAAAAGAKDELIVAAERGGWVDLFTKDGKFLRRLQSGARDRRGFVAVSADGATVAALGSDELGVIAEPRGHAWSIALSPEWEPLVAVAGNGSRIVTVESKTSLRRWSRDGAQADSIPLKAGEQVPAGRLSGLAVSTNGDAIAVAEEGSAVWLADPADKSVLRIALAARSVASLPDGTGFAVGLADGTVVRVSRDGTVRAPTVKASELGSVGRIAVAPDGQSFIAVDGDEGEARHLAWDGKLLAGPYRAGQSETISGAFFHQGSPKLIVVSVGSTADESFGVVSFAPPGQRQVISLDPPR
jgi:WD40 repeat protein